MSKLLERAIIDAQALKEAALKNAEQLVIEKYSEEVRSNMDKLIEQEDLGLPGEDMGAEAGLGMEDPGMGMEPTGDDPAAGEEGEEEALERDSLMGSLPDSFSADDDEIISIKLDSLDADYEDDDDVGVFGGDDDFADDEIGIDILDDEEETLGDLDDDEGLELGDEPTAAEDEEVGIDITEQIIEDALNKLGVDSEEEVDIEDLVEKLRVDFEPQKSGWAGTPEPHMREYESMLIAREQDSEVKEENEELRKNVAALQKENKTLTSAARKLQTRTKKYETAFNTLQEKLETMNVSNAKLLYINQALENASLNERQKRKIVEAISKADTVQEAKIVFDTMSDAVSTTSDVKRDSTLNEVVSRRSSLLVAARHEQKENTANPMYNRMQRLAGIKTKKS